MFSNLEFECNTRRLFNAPIHIIGKCREGKNKCSPLNSEVILRRLSSCKFRICNEVDKKKTLNETKLYNTKR